MSFKSHTSWFKPDQFPLNRHGMTVDRQLGGTKMRVCNPIDTGAYKANVEQKL